jgi:hypothetical protein
LPCTQPQQSMGQLPVSLLLKVDDDDGAGCGWASSIFCISAQ